MGATGQQVATQLWQKQLSQLLPLLLLLFYPAAATAAAAAAGSMQQWHVQRTAYPQLPFPYIRHVAGVMLCRTPADLTPCLCRPTGCWLQCAHKLAMQED